MKIYLSTFYSSDLKRSAKRFKEQAKNMEIYDKIFLFEQSDLNDDFKKYVKSLLEIGKIKGYGYWVWQTYFHFPPVFYISWSCAGFNYNSIDFLRIDE